jgi:hypothetical protein
VHRDQERVGSSGRGAARICMVSMRGINKHAAWCSNYEFEDVVASVDDVDMFTLEPGSVYGARQWLARRIAWKPGLRALTPFLNPGLKKVVIDRDYDVFIFVCMNPSELIYLSAVEGWQKHCRKRICYMAEFYSWWETEYAYQLSLLADFDFVAQSHLSCIDAIARASGRPCHDVPLGVDTLRFTPFPDPPVRCIDVYSMGRRVETTHGLLLEHARRRELFYIYDTIPSLNITPRDYVQHRELVANLGMRARFFIGYPAKIDTEKETGGTSVIGARYFEGAATGAVLLGQAPTAPEFKRIFHWPDAIVEIGSTADSVASFLAMMKPEAERFAAASRRNAVEALKHFDWAYRWKELLRLARVAPHPRLEARERRLHDLAAAADSIDPGN